MVLVDWTGAGRGPRAWSLAFLLFSAGARGLDRVRPAMFEVWAFAHGRKSLVAAIRGTAETGERAAAVATRARQALQRTR